MSKATDRPWHTVVLIVGFGFLYTPIAWIVYFSFSGNRVSGGPGLSLQWYRALADNAELRGAAWRSLVLALASAPVATLLGSAAGIALARLDRFPGRATLLTLLAVPLFAPEILIGFALLMMFAGAEALTGLPYGKGFVPLVIAHATLATPIVASIVFARVTGLDRSLEAAALDLGARPLRVLVTITVPLALPAILAGFLLALTLSFDDVVSSSFLAGPENTTLPMAVFSSVRVGLNPQINAIGTLMVIGVVLIAGLSAAAIRLGRVPSSSGPG